MALAPFWCALQDRPNASPAWPLGTLLGIGYAAPLVMAAGADAIENGYAVARAASGGISAFISPRGEVVQVRNHVEHGFGMLTGPLTTGDGEATFYARFGDLPMLVVCLALAGWALSRRSPMTARSFAHGSRASRWRS